MGILEERDLGLKRILEETEHFKDSYVCVGFFEGETHKSLDGSEEDIPLASIAAVHEYGVTITNGWGKGITIVIPERSFIRAWAAEHKTEIGEVIGELYNRVVTGEFTAKKALQLLGQFGVAGIKKKIDTGPFKELADSTLRMREHGGSKPLIDTGQMRNSVRSEVRTGEVPTEGVA